MMSEPTWIWPFTSAPSPIMSVSVETISPVNLPSMRTVPSNSSLPSNALPLPSRAFNSPGARAAADPIAVGPFSTSSLRIAMCVTSFWGCSSISPGTRGDKGFFTHGCRTEDQHQERFSGDEARSEWGAVGLLALRCALRPHVPGDAAQHHRHDGVAGDQHAQVDAGRGGHVLVPARLEDGEKHAQGERPQHRGEAAAGELVEPAVEQLGDPRPRHADGRGEAAAPSQAVDLAHRGGSSAFAQDGLQDAVELCVAVVADLDRARAVPVAQRDLRAELALQLLDHVPALHAAGAHALLPDHLLALEALDQLLHLAHREGLVHHLLRRAA